MTYNSKTQKEGAKHTRSANTNYHQTLARFRKLLSTIVTVEGFTRVYEQLLADACMSGNTAAQKLFLEYTCGKPVAEIIIDDERIDREDVIAQLAKRGIKVVERSDEPGRMEH